MPQTEFNLIMDELEHNNKLVEGKIQLSTPCFFSFLWSSKIAAFSPWLNITYMVYFTNPSLRRRAVENNAGFQPHFTLTPSNTKIPTLQLNIMPKLFEIFAFLYHKDRLKKQKFQLEAVVEKKLHSLKAPKMQLELSFFLQWDGLFARLRYRVDF